jgi:glucose-6-phosphate isomerase
MLTKNISFKNFDSKKPDRKILQALRTLKKEKNEIIKSLGKNYKNSFDKKILKKYKKNSQFNIIGMGGSILGARTIYSFLKHKIKKNFSFHDSYFFKNSNLNKKSSVNIIISKSGNTLETISNSNVLIKNNRKNIFITENKKSYLMSLAEKLKSDVVHHNNFIGGRYSVLSEVGMLPANLMGLNEQKFKRYNELIKNKKFLNLLLSNVSSKLYLAKKKFNSVILNYDQKSNDLFYWYQQLVAESLGKNKKGIFPIVSSMPRDNHSLLQLYLDGPKKNFFTFFFVNQNNSHRLNNKQLLKSHSFLKNKNLNKISYSQFNATLKVFKNKKIPFRCFNVKKRTEETLGELFTFFILETILLGKAMAINPYDQPAVELVKKETKKFLIKS